MLKCFRQPWMREGMPSQCCDDQDDLVQRCHGWQGAAGAKDGKERPTAMDA
jgi:hypothetical protein